MPTTPERLIEIATRHISHNERLKSHNVKEYAQFFEGMKNSVTNQLANKDLTKFSRDRLLALEKNIASDLKEINSEAYKTLKSQARDLAKYESGFEAKALNDVIEHSFNLPSTSQLNSAVFKTPLTAIEGPMKGKLLEGIIRDWSDRTVEKVNGAITAGYYQGKTTAAIVKDVVGTGANFTGGTLAQVKRDTEGLVRTSLQHAANQARQETWNQNSDIVKGVRIFATLDAKTSTICRSLDGQVFPLEEGPRPPFHINCRTSTTAMLDERFKILDEDATRSARDPETGEVYKVDSQRTYYDWLKGQPANVQDSIIGPTRGKLLREGGLTSKRFAELQLSKNFKPMTLAEMKAIEPIAFEKAGLNIDAAGKSPKPIDLKYTAPEGKSVSFIEAKTFEEAINVSKELGVTMEGTGNIGDLNIVNKVLFDIKTKLKISPDVKTISFKSMPDGDALYAARLGPKRTLIINKAHFTDAKIKELGLRMAEIERKKKRLENLKLKLKLDKTLSVDEKSALTKKINRQQKSLNVLQEKPFSSVTTSRYDLVVHELGHGIESTLRVFGEKLGIYDFLAPSRLRELGIKFDDTLGARLDYIAKTKGLKIGEYATKNAEEYFAESFVAFMKGQTEKIDPRVLKLFKEL